MTPVIGQPVSRVDGGRKTAGIAHYAADFQPPNTAFAVLVQSSIAKGRITGIDSDEARAAPGVLAVIDHGNAPHLPYQSRQDRPQVDPKAGDHLRVFQDDQVVFFGQPVAVVVAESFEQAEAAAALVKVSYAPEQAVTNFDEAARAGKMPTGRPADLKRGDADAAFAKATVKVDATIIQPNHFHNPMEPHATVARWEGDRLTLWDKTQWVDNVRDEIGPVFGIPKERIRVISPFVGGAFGSALRTWPHVTIAVLAAQATGRPVKLVLNRRQLFTSIGYRPYTVQRVRLGADGDGKLAAVIHEATGQTSAYEDYAETVVEPPSMLYATPNLRTGYRLAALNVNSPCPMRAPGSCTGVLALEMAMDELAEAANLDPLELRLRNYAETDPQKNLPWSSKSLRECYRVGAERFGWQARNTKPGGRMEGGLLVGHGMATAVYPTHRAPATANIEIRADGIAVLRSASSDMGPGTYTSMSQVVADELHLPIEAVQFELGDTNLPTAPVHGGSITMASVGSAVQAACRNLRGKCQALGGEPASLGAYLALLKRHNLTTLAADGEAKPGDEAKQYSMYAFGAVFAEVRVDPLLGQVRVPRVIGAYAAGKIVNPKIAHSQCIGGLVQGIGAALLERGLYDDRYGRVMNASLADYLVAVNADVPMVDALFVEEDDPHVNPLGVKGVGEIALVGVGPAIVNAVYNATGRRVRDLPLTPDKLLL